MASVLPFRFDELDLSELPSRAQQQARLQAQRLFAKLGKAERQLVRRQQIITGTIADGSREALYVRASGALDAVSAVLDVIPKIAPVRAGADRLDAASLRLSTRRDKLRAPSIPRYDELNVKQVNQALSELDAHQLNKVAAYERDHKNRVTVLREVERLLTR